MHKIWCTIQVITHIVDKKPQENFSTEKKIKKMYSHL